MDEQTEDLSKGQIDAGRGIAKDQSSEANKNTTTNQEDDNDRPDDRARKAGY